MKKMFCAVAFALSMATLAVADVRTRQVTCSASAGVLSSNTNRARDSYNVTFVNQGSVSAYLGGTSAVTTSTGLELKAAASFSTTLPANEEVYCVTASSTARVDVMEVGK